jgi:hypothetical protein
VARECRRSFAVLGEGAACVYAGLAVGGILTAKSNKSTKFSGVG